ncbi:hypothetical protein EPUL_002793 [Erysiphe pulchra]|uniref:Extracellular membrane protein CFEM domain-containing protein n=1 Tax=Erysiphe pulchra TaxID=225359 RepID=A0A2S4PVB1_9PEZI|nr:hypothetical protein EPUL_002793 [Erysiphe pulchra]
MKKKTIIIAAILPTTYAVSLSNFQRLPSRDITKNCEDVYNSDIPFCSQSDFTNSCSGRCITGLYAIAEEVSSACADISVTANSLLGMVLSGEMVNTLCPQPKLKLSKTSSIIAGSINTDSTTGTEEPGFDITSTQDSYPTTTRNHDPTTLRLTILTSQTPVSGPKLTTIYLTPAPYITSSISEPMIITTPKATMTLPNEGRHTLTDLSSSRTSSKTQPDKTNSNTDSSNDESGGGSPFDNQNFQSSATSSDKTSFCAMAIALIWACLLQR